MSSWAQRPPSEDDWIPDWDWTQRSVWRQRRFTVQRRFTGLWDTAVGTGEDRERESDIISVSSQNSSTLLWTEDLFGPNQRRPWRQTDTVLVSLTQFVSSLNEACFTMIFWVQSERETWTQMVYGCIFLFNKLWKYFFSWHFCFECLNWNSDLIFQMSLWKCVSLCTAPWTHLAADPESGFTLETHCSVNTVV